MNALVNQTTHRSLAGCGCTLKGLSDWPTEWFWKWLFQAEYDQVVITVHDRVEWNYMGWQWTATPPFYVRCGVVRCFPYDTTQKILNGYINLARIGRVAEYDPQGRFEEDTVRIVARVSGSTVELTRHHLYELYWATKDGSIPSGSLYLRPKTSEEHIKERQLPEGVDTLETTAKDVLKTVNAPLDTLKWVAIGLLGVGGAYVVTRVLPIPK